jgi:hypothetical protein
LTFIKLIQPGKQGGGDGEPLDARLGEFARSESSSEVVPDVDCPVDIIVVRVRRSAEEASVLISIEAISVSMGDVDDVRLVIQIDQSVRSHFGVVRPRPLPIGLGIVIVVL